MERSWKGLSTIAGSWIGGGANQTTARSIWRKQKHVCPDDCCEMYCSQFMDGVLLYGAQNQIKLTSG
jgi:hypothetical protein